MNATCDPQRNAVKPPLPLTGEIHVTHFAVKVDGHTERMFIAVINNEAVGFVIGKMQEWKNCSLRMMFVTPKHRFKGVGIRLLHRAENWARSEKAEALEIAVHKGNAEGRAWWIRRKFIDDLGRDMSEQPEYNGMVRML